MCRSRNLQVAWAAIDTEAGAVEGCPVGAVESWRKLKLAATGPRVFRCRSGNSGVIY